MLLDLFLSKKKYTANLAKKRLKIVIQQKQKSGYEPHYFPQLKNDLLLVIAKYVNIEPKKILVHIGRNNNIYVLKVNIPSY
ncbi:cell division topological specificity factor MinE [Buchnera aphidicola]